MAYDTTLEPRENSSGGPVSSLLSVEQLNQKFDQVCKERQSLEQTWKVNLAFYKGNQYVYYNRRANRIEQIPVGDGDKPRYRVRITSNRILPAVQSLLSKYTKTRPVMRATPGSGNDADVKAAQMSERLLEFWWQDMGLDDPLADALLWSIITGSGFWKICWDAYAGKEMSFLLDPMGQPIVDESAKAAFKQQLEQMGIPPAEQVMYLGDIKVEAVSPFDLYVDNTCTTFRDAKWAFHCSYLSPDEVKTRYGQTMAADAVLASPDASLPLGKQDSKEKVVRKVITGYFVPTPAMPQGRIVTWTEKTILEDQPWYYPTNTLPFVKFPGRRVPGSVYDSSVVEHAIPLQKELNRTLSQIVEYKNLMIRPQFLAPFGSLRTRMTTEPGAVWEYNPIAGLAPAPIAMAALPPYVFEHLNDLGVRMNEIFSLTEVTEGQVPPNVEAGVAIDLLQEMATDNIAPTIRLIELSLAQAGQQMLSLARKFYNEPRILKIRGSGGSVQVKKFTQADIDSEVSVMVEAGSGLPRTRAGRQARIQQYVEMGVLPPQYAYKYLDLADMKSIADKWSADEDKAARENDLLVVGKPLDMQAAQNAIMTIQQGIDPTTGQPLTGQEDLQSLVMQAASQPGIADDHNVHMDVHGSFLKSVEYETLDPMAQQLFQMHYGAHMMALQAMQQPEQIAPRVNLQLKSAVGPTAQSKILQQSGVDVTPEDSMEPPLETWVTDSVDKPDTDSGSPGMEGDPTLDMDLQHEQLRKATADADLAEKKAKAPLPKPGSNSG